MFYYCSIKGFDLRLSKRVIFLPGLKMQIQMRSSRNLTFSRLITLKDNRMEIQQKLTIAYNYIRTVEAVYSK